MTHQREAGTLTDGSPSGELKWPVLLGRMLEDLAHIFQLELRLMEAKLPPLMMAVADRAIGALVILYLGIIGGSCLLAALILGLHQWLNWWQCFAVGGAVTLICAFIIRIAMASSSISNELKEAGD